MAGPRWHGCRESVKPMMPANLQPGGQPSSKIHFLVGVDVGSTTVKAVVAAAEDGRILWREYRRHDTRQAGMLREFLLRMESEAGIAPGNCRIFVTGSGGHALAALIGARFVQEVNAVALAVEKLHPEAQSVIELGGQDAKIILFKTEIGSGRRRKIASMNDKCAGGTGAVIDKIQAKLNIPASQLPELAYRGVRIHPVAGKCGVFAETDINGLQKQGLPPAELMASLYDAIALQNLTVLTRGHTLLPHVLLLGGPNAFLRGMREAWQHNIPLLWKERGIELPPGHAAEELIQAPPDALYFAALGAIEFGRGEAGESGRYLGREPLERFLEDGSQDRKIASKPGLCASPDELQAFKARYQPAPFIPAAFQRGQRVEAFIGLDGGSTSTKAVLLSPDGEVLAKAYRLSGGNPIADSIEVLGDLRRQVEVDSGANLQILGLGTTGYAKEILQQVLGADAALVETVAHTESALHYFADPQVIVDVGGQDIKLILLRQGRVRDFRLNAQCSAGNGYFLQSTAEGFGIPVERYAETAFAAQAMPSFGYGCAVFLQSDIVNYQRQGWQAAEILAGLATVLPRNVFLHVAKAPNLTALGSRFILQGGTQKIWPRSRRRWTFCEPAFAPPASSRKLRFTRTAVKRVLSAPALKPCAWVAWDAPPPSSAWMRWAAFATPPHAVKRLAAASARMRACALFSMCKSAAMKPAASASSLPAAKRARSTILHPCAAFKPNWMPPGPPIQTWWSAPPVKSGVRAIRRVPPPRSPRAPGAPPGVAASRSPVSVRNCASAFLAS
jgi:activator of 2-hydroxyglutaryl-CoA dehydratase